MPKNKLYDHYEGMWSFILPNKQYQSHTFDLVVSTYFYEKKLIWLKLVF